MESCLHGQTYKGDEKQRSIKTSSEDVKKSLSVPAAVSIPTFQEKMPLGDTVQENRWVPSLPITYNDDENLSNLQTKLPEMVVLEKVLMQEKVVIGCTANTIQVIHCQKRNHWITVLTKWCQAG